MFLKRVFPYALAALAVCTAFFLISCGSDPQKTVEIHRTASSPQTGKVDFPHSVHSKAGIQCVECHHKKNNPERDKNCAACHQEENGLATMHKICVDCHLSVKKGPRQCDGCHKPLIRKE